MRAIPRRALNPRMAATRRLYFSKLILAALAIAFVLVAPLHAQVGSRVPDGSGNTIQPSPIAPPTDGDTTQPGPISGGGDGGDQIQPSPTPISSGTPPVTTLSAQQVWANTGTDFNDGTSWNSSVAPGAGDVAAFSGAAVTQPQLSASVSIAGLYFQGTSASGYDVTRSSSEILTLTASGTSIGAETGNADSVAIGAENTSGTNTIDVPIILAPASGTSSTISQAGGGTLNITGNISGSGNLIKNGAGTLVLSGNNSYTGGTTLDDGTLSLGHVNALGGNAPSNTLTINGGSLDSSVAGLSAVSGGQTWNGDFTFAGTNSLVLSGAISLGTAAGTTRTVTVNASTLEFTGGISNGTTANGLSTLGLGTLILSGTNTYTGVTQIGDQTVGGNVVPNGSTLQFAKEVSLYNNDHSKWTASNIVVGSISIAAFNVGGSGEFTSSDLDILVTLGTGTTGFKSGSAIGLDTSNASGGTFTYSSSVANPDAANNVFGLGLVKLGSGTLVLSGSNTYTGWTVVRGGTLDLTGSVGGNAEIESAGTLTGAGTIQGVLYNEGTMTLSSGTTTVNGSEGFTGVSMYSGSNDSPLPGITTINSGATLQVANDYQQNNGSTTIDGGTLSAGGNVENLGTMTLKNGGTINTPTGRVNNDGTFYLLGGTINGLVSNAASFTVDGTALVNGNVHNFATFQIGDGVNSSELTVSGSFGDGGHLTIASGSTLNTPHFTTSGSSEVDGTLNTPMIDIGRFGTLTFGIQGLLSNTTGTVNVGGPHGLLDLGGTNQTIGALNGPNSFNPSQGPLFGTIANNSGGTSTLTVGNGNANGEYDGFIVDNTNSGTGVVALTKVGTGTEILSANNTFTGATTINQGILQAAPNPNDSSVMGDDIIAASSGVSVASGATFDVNNTTQHIGALSGSGDVTLGTGTLTANVDHGSPATSTFSGVISDTSNGQSGARN